MTTLWSLRSSRSRRLVVVLPKAVGGEEGARVRAEIYTNYETSTGSISSLNFATENTQMNHAD